MNNTSKENVMTRLKNALENESIKTSEAGKILGTNPIYISMIKNPDTWKNVPKSAWEIVLKWINTGQKLKEYSIKHGKVILEKNNYADPLILIKDEEKSLKSEINNNEGKIANLNDDVSETFNVSDSYAKIHIDIEINLIINGKRLIL
jgi:hypothetical protein